MINSCIQTIFDLARGDSRVLTLVADIRTQVHEKLMTELPHQYIDYGIAESNMVASAAGLASCGKIPFLFTFENFLALRALEFIRNDVCAANLGVKLIGRSAGLTSSFLGLTHQATETLAVLRVMPNLRVVTPASPKEAAAATRFAYNHDGPVFLRVEGYNSPEIYDDEPHFEYGRGVTVRHGSDVTIITMGTIIQEAIRAAKLLHEESNLSLRIINIHSVKPIDEHIILSAAMETRAILVLEEHSIFGGLGSVVAEVIAENGVQVPFKRMGLSDFCRGCGSIEGIRELNNLTAKDIVKAVNSLIK